MWVKRLFLLLAALGLCAASAWFFVQSGDRALHAPAPYDWLPKDLGALTFVEDPFALTRQTRQTPVYQYVHPQFSWFKVLCPNEGDHPEWYFEHGAYLLTHNDTAALIFGMPDRWRQQETESWLASFLGAQPMRSGLLRLNDTLFAHLSEEAVCITSIADRPSFFRAKARDANTSLLHSLSHAGASTFNQFSDHEVLELPFLPAISTLRTVRDVYLENDGIIAEEVIQPDTTLNLDLKLPNGWINTLPSKLLRFDGIALPNNSMSPLQMRTQLLMTQDSASAAFAAFNGKLADLETSSGISASVLLEDWWTAGLAAISTPSASYLMLGSTDKSIALGSLRSYLKPKETRLSDGIVLSWEDPELLQHLLSPFTKMEVSAVWINDGAVIFSRSEQALIRLVTEVATGQTLPQEHILTRALIRGESFIRYHRNSIDWHSAHAKFRLPELSGEEGDAPHFIYSGIKMHDNRIVTRLELQTTQDAKGGVKLEWESALPGLEGDQLWSARNHITGGFYVLLQDKDHKLHAIDTDGKQMWEAALSEPILGEIEEVDLYRNGKVQLAFATSSGVHVLALNGRYVDGYPIKFKNQVSVTSPLHVADYDRQRNYRFLVGTSDGKLRNYRYEGETTPGWKHKPAAQHIVQVEHLKAGNKDYLFTLLADGSVKLLERDGTPRYLTSVDLSEIKPPVQFRMTGDIRSSAVICIDTAMQVVEFTFGASKGSAPIIAGRGSAFILADLNGDRLSDLVLIDSNSVEAYAADHSLIFEREFLEPLAKVVSAYTFSSGKKVGVTVPAQREIHLLEADGSSAVGFPLFGSGRFVIRDFDGDGNLELVTTDNEGLLLCYEL